MKAMVEVRQIHKSFEDRAILEGINLTIQPSETLAVIGPSGCGKSTLMRIIAGLDSPDEGSVTLADDNITLVFQYSALFDSLTVFENVAFSLLEKPDLNRHRVQHTPVGKEALQRLVEEKLAMVGLKGVEDLYPDQLSGGMQKRVSFARAIMSNPKIILYDEPTAGLDPIASTVIENYILALRDEIQASSIVVTHNLSTIRRVADRVCLLFNGQVRWEGPSDAFFVTDNPYAKQFASGSLEGPMTVNQISL